MCVCVWYQRPKLGVLLVILAPACVATDDLASAEDPPSCLLGDVAVPVPSLRAAVAAALCPRSSGCSFPIRPPDAAAATAAVRTRSGTCPSLSRIRRGWPESSIAPSPRERQRRSHLRDYLLTLAEIHGLVTVFVSSHGFRTYGLYRQFCYDCNTSFFTNVRRLASTHVLVPCAHAPANQGGLPSQARATCADAPIQRSIATGLAVADVLSCPCAYIAGALVSLVPGARAGDGDIGGLGFAYSRPQAPLGVFTTLVIPDNQPQFHHIEDNRYHRDFLESVTGLTAIISYIQELQRWGAKSIPCFKIL